MKAYLTIILIFACTNSGLAQRINKSPDPTAPAAAEVKTLSSTCEGPIYKSGELKQPAVFISRPKISSTEEARVHDVSGQIVIKAVLCRTGQVTDIEVIKGLPFGITEQTVESLRNATFTPAQKEGQAISQEITIDFRLSYIGEPGPLAAGPLEGRIIDSVEVTHYNPNIRSEVNDCISLIGGEVYKKALVERVWQKLLKIGNFDPQTSKIRIEESDMGGLRIVFQTQEKGKR